MLYYSTLPNYFLGYFLEVYTLVARAGFPDKADEVRPAVPHIRKTLADDVRFLTSVSPRMSHPIDTRKVVLRYLGRKPLITVSGFFTSNFWCSLDIEV